MADGAATGQDISYKVDVVLCIDVTASMWPVIEAVKQNAVQFPSDLIEVLAAKDKITDQLRIRVIAYRDVADNPSDWITDSGLLEFPADSGRFAGFINALEPSGGGDIPESGLEAVALALKSDWVQDAHRSRHVVVMWTDAPAHPLEVGYPHLPADMREGMPANFGELTDMWEGGQSGPATTLRKAARRFVLFAPESAPWTDVEEHWDSVVYFPSEAGKGMEGYDYKEILELLAASV